MLFTQILIAAETLKAAGVILITIMALGTHLHVATSRVMTDQTARSMRRQRRFALVGITLVTLGYVLEIYTHVKAS